MPFEFEERASDSPFAESVWRTASGNVERFLSVAVTRWEIVFMRRHGETTVTLRGPETKVSWADCPGDAEFMGIQFKLGCFMPEYPLGSLVDRPLEFTASSGPRFRLAGSTWELPTYDNADAFLARLQRNQLLTLDPLVRSALDGGTQQVSPRTLQRRFLTATGVTHRRIRQIDRAREAATLLRAGQPIAAVVEATGYADQPHLTRALRRLIGQTPLEIARQTVNLSMA
jgi:hypothetical protein